jgi:hypothetical protein
MTDPRPGPWEPTQASPQEYAYSDPAYGGTLFNPGYSSYDTGYSSAPGTGLNQTQQLPPYWTQTNPSPPTAGTPTSGTPTGDDPPEPPRSPRPWLWALAGFAVAAVIGLVAYLVFIVASPAKEKSVAATPSQTLKPTTRAPSSRPPSFPSLPPGMPSLPPGMPTLPSFPPIPMPGTPPNSSAETEPVTYDVTGTGIALTISYNGPGGMMQNDFGVELPWHKDVDLPKPARESASIIVTNSGKNVTCTISVGGKKVVERKGAVLTICAPTR